MNDFAVSAKSSCDSKDPTYLVEKSQDEPFEGLTGKPNGPIITNGWLLRCRGKAAYGELDALCCPKKQKKVQAHLFMAPNNALKRFLMHLHPATLTARAVVLKAAPFLA